MRLPNFQAADVAAKPAQGSIVGLSPGSAFSRALTELFRAFHDGVGFDYLSRSGRDMVGGGCRTATGWASDQQIWAYPSVFDKMEPHPTSATPTTRPHDAQFHYGKYRGEP